MTATKPNNPNSTPGTDRVKRENQFLQVVLLPPRVCHAMSRHLHTHKMNKMQFKKKSEMIPGIVEFIETGRKKSGCWGNKELMFNRVKFGSGKIKGSGDA